MRFLFNGRTQIFKKKSISLKQHHTNLHFTTFSDIQHRSSLLWNYHFKISFLPPVITTTPPTPASSPHFTNKDFKNGHVHNVNHISNSRVSIFPNLKKLFQYETRAVRHTGINLKMHMHEIIDAFQGQWENGSRWTSSHRGARLSFPAVWLHSNLFLDSLDGIKRQVDRDGCQEETESFFSAARRWLSGLQIWLEGCRLLREGQWFSKHSRCCSCCVTDNTRTIIVLLQRAYVS